MLFLSGSSKPAFGAAALLCAAALLLCGCSRTAAEAANLEALAQDTDAQAYAAQRASSVALPKTGGDVAFENEFVAIRTDTADSGYISVTCQSLGDETLKLQIAKGDKLYYYDLRESGDPLIFPLQMGDGAYTVTLFSQVEGDLYATVVSLAVDVALADPFAPFLLPNDYVDYDDGSEAVRASFLLSKDAETDLERVSSVFAYITENIRYDYDKAALVTDGALTGYLPDVDETLETGKGICFDYAALFAAMLRANGIPAKLVTGYVQPENVFHAWNMIFITDVGWINAEIQFDGVNWQLADPTFTASDSTKGATYTPVNEY